MPGLLDLLALRSRLREALGAGEVDEDEPAAARAGARGDVAAVYVQRHDAVRARRVLVQLVRRDLRHHVDVSRQAVS